MDFGRLGSSVLQQLNDEYRVDVEVKPLHVIELEYSGFGILMES